MTAFNVGDRVAWPVRDGWRAGEVIHRRPCWVPDGDGEAQSIRLTLRDEQTGRLVERTIRSCCARIPGQHHQRGEAA